MLGVHCNRLCKKWKGSMLPLWLRDQGTATMQIIGALYWFGFPWTTSLSCSALQCRELIVYWVEAVSIIYECMDLSRWTRKIKSSVNTQICSDAHARSDPLPGSVVSIPYYPVRGTIQIRYAMCGHARQLPIIRKTSGVKNVNLDLTRQPNYPNSILYQARNQFA